MRCCRIDGPRAIVAPVLPWERRQTPHFPQRRLLLKMKAKGEQYCLRTRASDAVYPDRNKQSSNPLYQPPSVPLVGNTPIRAPCTFVTKCTANPPNHLLLILLASAYSTMPKDGTHTAFVAAVHLDSVQRRGHISLWIRIAAEANK